MIYDIEDLKNIMAKWYFCHCNLHQPFTLPSNLSWKESILEYTFEVFQKFLKEEDYFILYEEPKKFDSARPFYFENEKKFQMRVWNPYTFKYEPILENFDDIDDYYFLYINKCDYNEDFRFIDYSVKSVSYSVLKNYYFNFQAKVFDNLGIAVLYSHRCKDYAKYRFLGVETCGHMIICPIVQNTFTEIAKNKKHFLIDKDIVKKMLIS